MNAQIQRLDTAALRVAYTVPRSLAPTDLQLDSNEGKPPSVEVMSTLAEVSAADLKSYPRADELEGDIARGYGLPPAQVCVTAGADDGLMRICRAYLTERRRLLLPVPTFEMIPRFAQWSDADIVPIPWGEPRYPLDSVLAEIDEDTGVIAVVSPNNPTGGFATGDDLRRISAAAPKAIILVDCAYAEFADEDLTSVALELPNAVVLRTLSKALGLAGIRLGYAMGPEACIERLRRFGLPYPVSSPSIALARRALRCVAERQGFIDQVRRERVLLQEALNAQGVAAAPSMGNYVFGRTPRAQWWCDAMAGLGIAIRSWPGDQSLGDAVRVTCPGNEHDYQRVCRAIETVGCPEAILFDLDGVLADVSRSYRQTIISTAASFGVVVTPQQIEGAKNAGNANNDWLVTQALMVEAGVVEPLETIRDRFEGIYWGDESTSGLYQLETFLGQLNALSQLAKRFKLGVVTGRPRRDALMFLERFGCLWIFSAVITMEDGPAKPSPRPVQRALADLNVERAWMLGDTPDDIVAARGAGVLPIGVIPPGADPESVRSSLLRAGAATVLEQWVDIEGVLP